MCGGRPLHCHADEACKASCSRLQVGLLWDRVRWCGMGLKGSFCTATLLRLARLCNAGCSQHGSLLTLFHANVRFPLPTCCTSPASSPTPSVQLLRRWEAGSPLRHLQLLPGTTHILMHLTVALALTQAMSHSLASFPSPAPSAQLPDCRTLKRPLRHFQVPAYTQPTSSCTSPRPCLAPLPSSPAAAPSAQLPGRGTPGRPLWNLQAPLRHHPHAAGAG